MKIALVHDQIAEYGGAERVLVALHDIYPEADVYTAFFDKARLGIHASEFDSWKIKESFAKWIPFFNKLYSPLRFLAPAIWESFDFTGYDLVISSSAWYMCKGVKTKSPTVHICYLHTPPRYLYGYDTAIEWQKYFFIKIYANVINLPLRMWDYASGQRPNYFIANSQETKKRISKFYRRDDAVVIYPPVQLPEITSHELRITEHVIPSEVEGSSEANTDEKVTSYKLQVSSYFVTLSRLARAKHIDVIIEACKKLDVPLKVVGTGRDEEFLKSTAGPKTEFLGHVPDDKLAELYTSASAFLCAAVDEEFGIAPVEAMGYGVPVIAYASGGLKETVDNGKNGFLYGELTAESLVEAIGKYQKLTGAEKETMRIKAAADAQKYSYAEFEKQIEEFVNKVMPKA